jgi:hypothetical protein
MLLASKLRLSRPMGMLAIAADGWMARGRGGLGRLETRGLRWSLQHV